MAPVSIAISYCVSEKNGWALGSGASTYPGRLTRDDSGHNRWHLGEMNHDSVTLEFFIYIRLFTYPCGAVCDRSGPKGGRLQTTKRHLHESHFQHYQLL